MQDELLALCCKLFDVHPRDLVSSARFGFLLKPRFAMYKALQLRGWSTPKIGRFIGGRDHSTVCHGIKRAEYHMERDAVYKKWVLEIAAATSQYAEENAILAAKYGRREEEDDYD